VLALESDSRPAGWDDESLGSYDEIERRRAARKAKKGAFRQAVKAARTTVIESADELDPDQTPTQKRKASSIHDE
jgi:hypothetical protein